MPTCSKCSEHLALLELAKVAMLILADADLNESNTRYEVDTDLIERLQRSAEAIV